MGSHITRLVAPRCDLNLKDPTVNSAGLQELLWHSISEHRALSAVCHTTREASDV